MDFLFHTSKKETEFKKFKCLWGDMLNISIHIYIINVIRRPQSTTIKSCYSFSLSIQNLYAMWQVIIWDKPTFMGSTVSGSPNIPYPWLLSHEDATHTLPTTHWIMTSFNIKRTSERYFNNLIIQMKE